MKNEIEIPVQKEEDFVAANLRRDIYSQTRDVQAQEYNTAISARLLAQEKNQSTCEKCGRRFTSEPASAEEVICPDCRLNPQT
jgi:PHP family Zn ribbon phosphoesterase